MALASVLVQEAPSSWLDVIASSTIDLNSYVSRVAGRRTDSFARQLFKARRSV